MENFKQDFYNKNNFIQNNLETSIRLSEIISKIYHNDILNEKLILKGGGAIECYLGDVKRLFLDVDLDFKVQDIKNIEKERQNFREQLFEVMRNLGYEKLSSKSRYSYSLDSFKFPYYKKSGNLDYIKLEINYSNGNHLYPNLIRSWVDDNLLLNTNVAILNLEELIGMKLAALLERGLVKDLFDIYYLINIYPDCDIEIIRKIYLFYFALSSKEEKLLCFNKILDIAKRDLKIQLYPLIKKQSGINLENMKNYVLNFVREALNFTNEELQFLKLFERGDYYPELLFQEKEVVKNAKDNSIAEYKVKVRKYFYSNKKNG